VLGQATDRFRLIRLTWPGLGGSHHLPPYNILCASSQAPHPNDILFRDSQLSKLGFPQLCRAITLCEDLESGWCLKQSYSPRWELSNIMLHATCTQGNWGDSWLLVVGSQFVNMIPNFSFDHNLCFRCPNGSCEPTLDIYVPINFQWYNELFNLMGFDLCNYSLKI
jgi:hypothetical protein